MLAPLKDRSIIEQEAPEQELAQIRLALRQARAQQRRSATLAARRIVAQENAINRLQTLLDESQTRLRSLESGQAVVELGQRLLRLQARNDELAEAARRLWTLDKALAGAHAECARLARERDALARRLLPPARPEAAR